MTTRSPHRSAADLPQRGEPYRQIVARLSAAQKSSRGASLYARWVNRPLGRWAAGAAFKAGWTPNNVTALSASLTLLGLTLTAALRPNLGISVLIVVILLAGFALDAADGQLARLRGGGSAAGEWLDHVVDAFKCSAVHVVVLICWFRFFDVANDALLLVPLAFGLESSVFYFTIMLTEQLRRAASGATARSSPAAGGRASLLRSAIVLPADYGVLVLSFLLLGFHRAFEVVYIALLAVNIVFFLGALRNWYRQMVALD